MKWTKWVIAYAVIALSIALLFSYVTYIGGSMVPFTSHTSWAKQNGSTTGFHHK